MLLDAIHRCPSSLLSRAPSLLPRSAPSPPRRRRRRRSCPRSPVLRRPSAGKIGRARAHRLARGHSAPGLARTGGREDLSRTHLPFIPACSLPPSLFFPFPSHGHSQQHVFPPVESAAKWSVGPSLRRTRQHTTAQQTRPPTCLGLLVCRSLLQLAQATPPHACFPRTHDAALPPLARSLRVLPVRPSAACHRRWKRLATMVAATNDTAAPATAVARQMPHCLRLGPSTAPALLWPLLCPSALGSYLPSSLNLLLVPSPSPSPPPPPPPPSCPVSSSWPPLFHRSLFFFSRVHTNLACTHTLLDSLPPPLTPAHAISAFFFFFFFLRRLGGGDDAACDGEQTAEVVVVVCLFGLCTSRSAFPPAQQVTDSTAYTRSGLNYT